MCPAVSHDISTHVHFISQTGKTLESWHHLLNSAHPPKVPLFGDSEELFHCVEPSDEPPPVCLSEVCPSAAQRPDGKPAVTVHWCAGGKHVVVSCVWNNGSFWPRRAATPLMCSPEHPLRPQPPHSDKKYEKATDRQGR